MVRIFATTSYLAFVGVTLVGVQDADFFIPERETQLPLIGVSIPTALFFTFAPALGAALFAYFHLHLLKLWDALAIAPATIKNGDSHTPISDHITPWLITDLALVERADALRPRSMQWLSRFASYLLAFWAAPLVLVAFWWRSMPKHDVLLTVLACGLPLCLAIYTARTSRKALKYRLRQGAEDAVPRRTAWIWLVLACTVSTVGWLRTGGTLNPIPTPLGIPVGTLSYPEMIAKAQLQNVIFVPLPETWRSDEVAREAFQTGWCRDHGVAAVACHVVLGGDKSSEPRHVTLRKSECLKRLEPEKTLEFKKCDDLISDLSQQMERAWKAERAASIAALPDRNLVGSDLRFANLSGAVLLGANLVRAQLQGANLRGAQLQGADLFGAQLQGADLLRAQLQGADLFRAQFDADTSFTAATLRGAAVKEVDFTSVPQIADHIDELFGDNTVIFPKGMQVPDRFNVEYEGWDDFENAWRDFQHSIDQDPDNPI